jgi:hypothetical protein
VKPRYITACNKCKLIGQVGIYDIHWCKLNPDDFRNIVAYYANHAGSYLHMPPYCIILGIEIWNDSDFYADYRTRMSEDEYYNLYLAALGIATKNKKIKMFEGLNK